MLPAGLEHVEIVDSGADLNAYAKIEKQAGCCSPAMGEQTVIGCEIQNAVGDDAIDRGVRKRNLVDGGVVKLDIGVAA